MTAAPIPVEHATQLAVDQKVKLKKSLRRFDMVFFTLCALVGLDTLGVVASYGPQGIFWLVLLAAVFIAPYMLLMSEVGSTFTEEGGPYEWVKLAFGRAHAGIAAVVYWASNPFWVGGSLAFIASEAWERTNLPSLGVNDLGSAGDYIFKLLFIWFSITVAIVSIQKGKWIPNAGAIARILVLGFFSLTLLIYAGKHGLHSFAFGKLSPSLAVLFALAPAILFNYVGFELQNGAAEEMVNPQKDVPISVLRSGILGIILYCVPIGDDRMTAWEMVEYFGRLYGMRGAAASQRLEEIFTTLQMNEFRDVLGSKMSTGMKQKVSIARAIVHDPPVLIFDEPTTGLDVLVARAVLKTIAELRDQGKCIIFSTHIMREAEKLCDRVAIIHKGRILAEGTPTNSGNARGRPDLEELFFELISRADERMAATSMNWRNVNLIFLREVRDQLRDRRTLFMIVVLPLLLYPGLAIGMVEISFLIKEQPRTIVLLGSDNLPAEPPLASRQSLRPANGSRCPTTSTSCTSSTTAKGNRCGRKPPAGKGRSRVECELAGKKVGSWRASPAARGAAKETDAARRTE